MCSAVVHARVICISVIWNNNIRWFGKKERPVRFRGCYVPQSLKIPLEKIPVPPTDFLGRLRETLEHIELERKRAEERAKIDRLRAEEEKFSLESSHSKRNESE